MHIISLLEYRGYIVLYFLTITVMGSHYGNLKINLKVNLTFWMSLNINEGGNLIFWLYTHVGYTELKALANQ